MKPSEIMLVLVFILFGLLAISTMAAEAVLTEDEKLQCRLGGGCLFITQDALISQLQAARELGKREAATADCKRPRT